MRQKKDIDELVPAKVKSGEAVSKVLEYKTLNIDWSFVGFTIDYDNEEDCWAEIEDYLYSNK